MIVVILIGTSSRFIIIYFAANRSLFSLERWRRGTMFLYAAVSSLVLFSFFFLQSLMMNQMASLRWGEHNVSNLFTRFLVWSGLLHTGEGVGCSWTLSKHFFFIMLVLADH